MADAVLGRLPKMREGVGASRIDQLKETTGKIVKGGRDGVEKEKLPSLRAFAKGSGAAGRALRLIFLTLAALAMTSGPAHAATMWDLAGEIMQDVYNQIVLISTLAAIVTASVALLLMNFSRCGKTVDESRSWLWRIAITWVILNGLGFIMAYITPFFAGGRWNP